MGDLVLYLSTFSLSVIVTKFKGFAEKHKVLYFLIVLLFPVLIATIRVDVGTDYRNYYWCYELISTGESVPYEFLFVWLNKISIYLFQDFRGVFFLSALITYGCILWALERLNSDISVSISLWIFYCIYFPASLNGMRQLIAVAIVFLAYTYLNEEKYKHFFVLMIIAILFHTSSLVAIFALLIKIASKKNCGITITVIAIVSIFLLFFSKSILRLLPDFIMSEFGVYIGYEKTITLQYIIDLLPTFGIVFLPIIYYMFFCRSDNRYDFYCCLGSFVLPIIIFGYNVSYFQRIAYYFDVAQMIIPSLLITRSKISSNRIIFSVFFVLFYAYFFWFATIKMGGNEIVPFKSIFS